jgi:hypothetical protein
MLGLPSFVVGIQRMSVVRPAGREDAVSLIAGPLLAGSTVLVGLLRLPARPGAAQATALVLPDQFGCRRHVIAHGNRHGCRVEPLRGDSDGAV